ncbi:hypothetical protein H0H92_014477 [Tricholoma furcatifolium]|nr:hypothetical protein H0H92_014477 [Tricholoma furcatifolium]
MLSLFVFHFPLLVHCLPLVTEQTARDAPQAQFSLIPSPQSNASSIPFQYRPVKTPDSEFKPVRFESPPQRLVMAYFPDWVADSFRPEDIPYRRFDWIDFAFSVPTEDKNLGWDDDSAPDKLHRLVSGAHACGTKVKLSLGGWTGSRYFSSDVQSSEARTAFANNILKVYKQFDVDGIDIDWEYPGNDGAAGNQVNPKDTQNFLQLLRTLRSVLPASTCITTASQTVPFADESGEPMLDLSEFADQLNWTMIMNYDATGSSPSPGPNAPLSDGCKNSSQPDSNAASAVQRWMAAGFPPEKLVLGVPSYGYLSSSSAETLHQRRKARFSSSRGRNKSRTTSDVRLIAEDDQQEGQIMFRELVRQGALVRSPLANGTQDNGASSPSFNANNSSTFVGVHGFTRYWDSCSETPFLRSPSQNQVATYDDPESFSLKAEFVKKMGLRGVNMFDTHGDTDEGDLTMSLRNVLEFST